MLIFSTIANLKQNKKFFIYVQAWISYYFYHKFYIATMMFVQKFLTKTLALHFD